MSRQAITEESGVHKQWYEDSRSVTRETLPEFIRKLTEDYAHDYGTICHAVAASALAAARAVDHAECGGITGFQAGAVMWEFIQDWQHMRGKPLRLVNYEDMLYPQHDEKFMSITAETWTWLRDEAGKRLAEGEDSAHPAVRDHWQRIVDGVVPFGYTVRDDRA